MEAVVGAHARRSRAYPAGRCRILAQPTRQAPPVSDFIYKMAPARLIQHAPFRRFAANLAYLFTERPLIERFAAAAAAGFRAVELQLPYDHAPSAVRAELDRH